MDPPRDYISSTEQNQIRMRMERVLGSQGRSVRLKIDSELLQLIVITSECTYKKLLINPVIESKPVIISHDHKYMKVHNGRKMTV
jgi:hypothetical protein